MNDLFFSLSTFVFSSFVFLLLSFSRPPWLFFCLPHSGSFIVCKVMMAFLCNWLRHYIPTIPQSRQWDYWGHKRTGDAIILFLAAEWKHSENVLNKSKTYFELRKRNILRSNVKNDRTDPINYLVSCRFPPVPEEGLPILDFVWRKFEKNDETKTKEEN